MSYTYIADKKVIPRKNHRCRVCSDTTPKGEECHSLRGVDDDGFYTLYFHNECWTYSRIWINEDWECIAPGDISRKEVLADLIPPTDNNPNPRQTRDTEIGG